MGFNETDHEIIGKYRDHNVTIDEIERASEEPSIYTRYTRYRVDFENRQDYFFVY